MSAATHSATQAKHAKSRIAARVFLEPGTSPGYLHPFEDSPAPVVTVLETKDGRPCSITPLTDFANLPKARHKGLAWVRVTGLGAVEPLLKIASFYGLRRLTLEDTLACGWRTKIEQQDNCVFMVLQGPPDAEDRNKSDHLTLFFTRGLIITFEDRPTQVVDHLWKRLQEEPAAAGTDNLAEFLTYMLLDILIDGFFPHLDKTDETLASLEELLLSHVPKREELSELYQVKRTLITLRRLLTPFKEIRADLFKSHPPEALEDLKPFFRDLSDHILEVDEMLHTYSEVTESLDQTCQSIIGNRVNEIVRVLTILSSIFMPLSLIAGIYGMNFEVMPELHWKFGYPASLVLMAAVVAAMLVFFRKRRWL